MTRTVRTTLIAAAASAILATSGPVAAQSRSTMTVNGMTVTVLGGGSISQRSTPAGAELSVNGTPIFIGSGEIVVDGQTYAVEVTEQVVVDLTGGALSVIVDGTPLAADAGQAAPDDPLAALRAQAAAGDPEALNDLGVAYGTGDGVPVDAAIAADYYRQAADLGLAVAQMNYAWRLWEGDGVAEDRAGAVAYATLAMEQGNAVALRFVGTAHWLGDGVGQDRERGLELWRQAAMAGDAVAARNLGAVHEIGEYVAVDLSQARRWLQRAVELGDEDAVAMLAALDAGHAEAEWWYADGSEPAGPVDWSELRSLALDGTLGADTLVWQAGTEDWVAAGTVTGLID